MNRLVSLLMLLLFCQLLPAAAFPLTPADLLLVCNSALEESCDTARHYAGKRDVPATNILELVLPTGESMVRGAYESKLAGPLRERVAEFIAKQGQNPVLLLVYGVPLKINADAADDIRKVRPELVRTRISGLTSQIAQAASRLQEIVEPDSPSSPDDEASPGEILQRAGEAIRQGVRFLNSQSRGPGAGEGEIKTILLLLTGIAPQAESLTARTAMRRPEAKSLLQAPVLQMHSLLAAKLGRIPFRGVTTANVHDLATTALLDKGLLGELRFWLALEEQTETAETSAAVDSELTLLLADSHTLHQWLPNPFLEKFDGYPGIETIRGSTLMVARLDGPTAASAKRLVDDGLAVEEKGLRGTFYIDARGLAGGSGNAYAEYDRQLRQLHALVKEKTSFPVVLDDRPELFPAQSCPDAALYCGWYSLARYQDCFDWQQGAVGFHVASGEAATLRRPGSQVWCKRMLEEGVAATLGPVEEPYLQSFPRPDEFFPLLMTGRLPLVQVYFRTLPFLSWRQILIGDPLYTPFGKNPAWLE